jgi:very-short-patch-repair endonuclease
VTRTEDAEASLLWQLRHDDLAHMVPEPVLEHRFHPVRRWRFDVAWPDRLLALEVDGGGWIAGHHSRGQGIEDDAEKQSTAVSLGWRVMRLTPRMIRDGRAITLVIAAHQQIGAPR